MDQQFATDWLQVACPVYKVKDWIKSIKFCLQWFKLVDCPVHRKNYYQVESTHTGSTNVDCILPLSVSISLYHSQVSNTRCFYDLTNL